MKISNCPIDVESAVTAEMIELNQVVTMKLETRFSKFASDEDKVDHPTKIQMFVEIEKLFKEINRAILKI